VSIVSDTPHEYLLLVSDRQGKSSQQVAPPWLSCRGDLIVHELVEFCLIKVSGGKSYRQTYGC